MFASTGGKKSLLKQAGVSGLQITVPILGGGAGRMEQLLQQDLKQVGINVKLITDQADVYDVGTKLQSKYPLWHKSWGMGLPDPSELVSRAVANLMVGVLMGRTIEILSPDIPQSRRLRLVGPGRR